MEWMVRLYRQLSYFSNMHIAHHSHSLNSHIHATTHNRFKQPSRQTPSMQPLEPFTRLHRPPALLRLAPVRPPALDLLVAAQARPQADVDARRRVEPEALGHLDQVEFVHVEDGAQRVRGVRLQVAPVAVFGGFVEVVVFGDERFELGLDVCCMLAWGLDGF